MSKPPAVVPGIDVLLAEHIDWIAGKRIGLLIHPAAVNMHLQSTAALLLHEARTKVVALYGPEHGVRGNAQAGEFVPFYFDDKYQLPVFSLYGQNTKPPPDILKDIDHYMRSFDTQHSGKIPEQAMIHDIDALVIDLQDIGTRVYTYIATMAYAMQACAEAHIPCIVLDRPNPIGGIVCEGPLIEYPAYSSFVGLYPIPVRHGLTSGELALLFNAKYLPQKAALTVIPIKHWRRSQWFDQTGLPWVPPSPNMPTLDTATVYPGQVFFEGTNLSEGRGTTRPFETIGAPWIDGFLLAQRLNEHGPAGVIFRETWFTPTFSKFSGQLCGGVQLHITDRACYQPFAVMLKMITIIRSLYPKQFAFHAEYFDRIAGSNKIRTMLEKGCPVDDILALSSSDLKAFAELSKPYRLYQ